MNTRTRTRRKRLIGAVAALAALGAVAGSGPALGGEGGSVRDLVYVDKTPPDTSVDGPTLTRDSSPRFDLGSTERRSSFACKLDKRSYERCSDPYKAHRLRDGEHTLSVRATDRAGNTDPTPAVHDFEIDSTPPKLIVHGPQGLINNPDPEFEVEINEQVEFACSLNYEVLDHCSPTVGVGTLEDGAYTLRVSATDAAGNRSRVMKEFQVDTEVDTVITHSPKDAVSKRKAKVRFESPTDKHARFFCAIDGGEFRACKSPKHLRGLSAGPHTFAVYAVDRAGNVDETPEQRTLEIIGRG